MFNKTVHPQWIAKMYAGKTGRDHLGLGSVSSDQILPSLSSSINVLTFHPRYHSFYVFLLDEYWRRDLHRTQASWVKFFRPREFIFSVGAYLCDQPEHIRVDHIVGGQKTGPLASRLQPAYATNTDYIDSLLGGYGLYYRTVMAELGIIYPGGPGYSLKVDIPSEYGKKVAEAFRQAVKDTKYYQSYFDLDNCEVPIDVIQEYIRSACLCQLQKTEVPDHNYLVDSFLHRQIDTAAKSRRETFRLLLDIAEQTEGVALDEDKFRQMIYFGTTTGGIRYSPSNALSEVYARWRLYQAREYYAFALNAMWYYFCEWGLLHNGDLLPIPLSLFWDHINEEVQFDRLSTRLGLPNSTLKLSSGFRSLEEWLLSLGNVTRDNFDQAFRMQLPIHEHALYRMAIGAVSHPEPTAMITAMVSMLALIHLRFDVNKLWTTPEWEIARMGSDGRLSIDGFLRNLDRRLQSGPVTIQEIVHWIIEDYVILQHQLVATGKLPDNTFRFKREGNRVQFYKLENTLTFMNSRFEALATTIHELGLCGNLFLPNHRLTADGKKLLEEGDLHG